MPSKEVVTFWLVTSAPMSLLSRLSSGPVGVQRRMAGQVVSRAGSVARDWRFRSRRRTRPAPLARPTCALDQPAEILTRYAASCKRGTQSFEVIDRHVQVRDGQPDTDRFAKP